MTIDDLPCFGQQLVPNLGQQGLYLFYLIGSDGRTRIALDTAGTIAAIEVTQKLFFEYVERYDYTVYFNHVLKKGRPTLSLPVREGDKASG